MFNSPAIPNPGRFRQAFVKLFDSFGHLHPIDQAPDAKKASIADHRDDIERVLDVGKRVTVHENQVCRRTDGNARDGG